ncbi:MAG: hypothetical protein ACAI43_14075 [Phycisphaerae bacterium]|nr:hypothetical protein [Tepidisphaeraceae bacterium]
MILRRLAVIAAFTVGSLSVSAQTWKIDRQLNQDFPGQRKTVLRQFDAGGTRVFDVKLTGARGDSTVSITEGGDYLLKSVPTRLQFLPDPVTHTLNSIFRDPAQSSHLVERTTYQVDVQQDGKPPVRLDIDATGRVRDIIGAAQIHGESRAINYEKVTWREGDEVAQKIAQYFDGARITAMYRHPAAPGFYYADLTADRGTRAIQIVMDTRKEIPFWRFELRGEELPKPVMETVKELVVRGRITRIMRAKDTLYHIEQPVRDDLLVIDIRPTGDVVSVKGNLSSEVDDRYLPGRKKPGDRYGDVRR